MDRLAFLAGLFLVPVALLALGHRFRHRAPRSRAAFWGALSGYLAAVLLTTVLAVVPPLHWSGGSPVRALLVHWSLLLGALAGAGAGLLRARLRA